MAVEQRDFTLPVILTICFLACSIAACGAVLIHFIVKKASLQDTPSRLLFCLALSDLIGAVVWFLDILLPGLLCPYSGAVNMWGYQSAQFWTCIIGGYLIVTCSAKIPLNELYYYAFAWGVPSLVQVIILYLKLYSVHPAPHGCWIQYGNIGIAFVTFPQIMSAVLNFIFLSTIVYKMRISAKRWGLQSRDRGLFFVMICYVFTTISAILESVPNGSDSIYTVAVCFGALQGFFNSIAMKQKAILQFMGTVKTKIRPNMPRRRPIPDYGSPKSPSDSTWLLKSDTEADTSAPKHPAINDSYTDYYTRTLHSSLGRAENGQASMDNLSFTRPSLIDVSVDDARPPPSSPTNNNLSIQ